MFLVLIIITPTPAERQGFQYNVGPSNITRKKWERNVFIPCVSTLSNYNTTFFPVWEIDGIFYDLFSLPGQIKPAAYGLVIPNVTSDLNGTKFRCYNNNINSVSGEPSVLKSDIGTLTVKTPSLPVLYHDRLANTSAQEDTSILTFDLDHHQLLVSNDKIEIVWTPNMKVEGTCTSSNLIWSIRITRCSYSKGYTETFNTNETHYTLYKDQLNNLSFTIVGYTLDGALCQEMNETLLMDQSCKAIIVLIVYIIVNSVLLQ